jgi:hypothetical protein
LWREWAVKTKPSIPEEQDIPNFAFLGITEFSCCGFPGCGRPLCWLLCNALITVPDLVILPQAALGRVWVGIRSMALWD